MSTKSQMKGARLEFVVREQKGKIKRPFHSFNKKTGKIEATLRNVDAGYLVYTPQGNVYRLSRKELVERGYDRQPKIMNLDKVEDTESAAGRFKHAISLEARQDAWKDLENQVITACNRKNGPTSLVGEMEVGDEAAA